VHFLQWRYTFWQVWQRGLFVTCTDCLYILFYYFNLMLSLHSCVSQCPQRSSRKPFAFDEKEVFTGQLLVLMPGQQSKNWWQMQKVHRSLAYCTLQSLQKSWAWTRTNLSAGSARDETKGATATTVIWTSCSGLLCSESCFHINLFCCFL